MSWPSILYASHDTPSGYGVAGRRLVMALEGAGVPISWVPLVFNSHEPRLPDDTPAPMMGLDHLRRAAGAREGAPDPDVIVLHTIPEFIPHLESLRLEDHTSIVCHTVWEADRLQPHWPLLLNRTRGVIVPTQWNAEAFRRAGVTVPVSVVPHVACTDSPEAAWIDAPPVSIGQKFMVGSIAQWTRRKAPWRSLEVFARALGPDAGAMCVLQSGPGIAESDLLPPGPDHLRATTAFSVARALHALPPAGRVHLSVGDRSFEEIAGFHQRSDCYVALPHSEGWDLGTFDAAAAGTPVITTAFGGPLEYLDPAASDLIDGPLIPYPKSDQHQVMDQDLARWMAPDVEQAVAALRAIRADPELANQRAATQAVRLRAHYAPAVVADQFLLALAEMGLA